MRIGGNAVAIGLAVAVGAGCTERECELDEARCDGETAMVCVSRDTNFFSALRDTAWQREDCSAVAKRCVARERRAFCAVATATDRRCDSSMTNPGRRTVCDGTHLLSCDYGFLLADDACANACISNCSSDAFCAESSAVDPLCANDAVSACDGDLLVSCACGIRARSHACQSPGSSCVLITPGTPQSRQQAGCR